MNSKNSARVWIRMSIVLFTLILAALGLLEFSIWKSKQKLQQTIKDLEARGESFDVRTFVTPEDETSGTNQSELTRSWYELYEHQEFRSALNDALDEDKDNSGILPVKHLSPQTPNGTDWNPLQALFQKYSPYLRTFQSAASAPNLKINRRNENLIVDVLTEDPLRSFIYTPGMCHFLEQCTIMDLQAGRCKDAVADIQMILNITALTSSYPDPLCQALTRSQLDTANSATWELLQSATPDDAQLKTLQNMWQSFHPLRSFSWQMRAERSLAMQNFFKSSPLQYSRFQSERDRPGKTTGDKFFNKISTPVAMFLWRSLYQYSDERELIETSQYVIDLNDAVVLNQKHIDCEAVTDALDEREGQQNLSRTFSNDFQIGPRSDWRNAFLAEAVCRMTITALALRRHQLAMGHLPENLTELVPSYLPSVPLDPFDGNPLRYQRKGENTFTLYAIGNDLVDDGGESNPLGGGRTVSRFGGPDVVWPPTQAA